MSKKTPKTPHLMAGADAQRAGARARPRQVPPADVPYSRTQPADEPLPVQPAPMVMPARATKAELTKGLSDERLAELERLAAHLRLYFDGEDVAAAINRAAREHRRSVATYERAFSDLARAAAWDSRTPQDYLRGTPTPERGTKRGNAPRLTERMAARLAPETKEKLDAALAKMKAKNEHAGINELIDAMTTGYLDGRI